MTRTAAYRIFLLPALVVLALFQALPASAASEPSSDLLLPWFEVHL